MNYETTVRFQAEIDYMEAINRRCTQLPEGVMCRHCEGDDLQLVQYAPQSGA